MGTRQLHAQSVVAFPGNMYFGNVDGPFRSFAHVTLIHERAAVPAAGRTWVLGQRGRAVGMEAFDEELTHHYRAVQGSATREAGATADGDAGSD